VLRQDSSITDVQARLNRVILHWALAQWIDAIFRPVHSQSSEEICSETINRSCNRQSSYNRRYERELHGKEHREA